MYIQAYNDLFRNAEYNTEMRNEQRADPKGRTLRKKSEADRKCMLMENCEVEKVHSSKFRTAGRAASREINCRACAGITR